MKMNTELRRGFTLVEVLIVVVIMAVLAGVVIPQFSASTDDARKATAEFNVSSLRSVMETYKAHHRGLLPAHDAPAKTLSGLTRKTLADGTLDAEGAYGPYLLEIPENSFTGKTDVALTTKASLSRSDVTAGSAGGWLYNATTGHLFLDSDPGYDF
jgi:prepilin-type N-terminal cleavage/methylation domain-containing protein